MSCEVSRIFECGVISKFASASQEYCCKSKNGGAFVRAESKECLRCFGDFDVALRLRWGFEVGEQYRYLSREN
jgi:hypothetical protein